MAFLTQLPSAEERSDNPEEIARQFKLLLTQIVYYRALTRGYSPNL